MIKSFTLMGLTELVNAINEFSKTHDVFATNFFQPINNNSWSAIAFYNQSPLNIQEVTLAPKRNPQDVEIAQGKLGDVSGFGDTSSNLPKKTPATQKQIFFLKKNQVIDDFDGLTKQEAIGLIKNFKENQK